MAVRHVPYWLDRFPKGRRPSYPRLRGQLDTSVVIVGGGLTGCACAAAFATAGVKVVLLEAEAIGAASARRPGLVREDFDASFRDTAALHGLRAARALWQSMRRASLDFPAALRRLQVRCELEPLDLLRFTRRDPDTAKALQREYRARRDGGLDHSWLTQAALLREAGIDGGVAIRTRGAALDPYRASIALAADAARRGAAVHEKSGVVRIRAGRKQVEVTTAAASVRADAVVVATSAPIADLRALRRHVKSQDAYAVVTEPLPAAVRRETGRRQAALRDSDLPPHLLRWMRDDRVLFAGAEQPTLPARAREKALVQRSGQLMYELSTLYPAISGLQPEWTWHFTQYATVDELPFIGLHRNFPRHLFAMAGGRHGAGVAWLAARTLLRQFQGDPVKGDERFGFSRVL